MYIDVYDVDDVPAVPHTRQDVLYVQYSTMCMISMLNTNKLEIQYVYNMYNTTCTVNCCA